MAEPLTPPFRPLHVLSIGVVLLIVVQIILGFATLATSNDVIAWVHLLVAMAIYGMAIAGAFMSMRLDYRSIEQSVRSVRHQTYPLSFIFLLSAAYSSQDSSRCPSSSLF